MTKFYLILCLSASVLVNAQTSTKKELKLIESKQQAKDYLENNKSKNNKLITFNQEKHNTTLAKSLFKLGKGRTKINESEYGTTYYKVVDKIKTKHYRVSTIYLDGSVMSLDEINKLREDIINKYENGLPFANLVKKYSMDNNVDKGGDIGWFAKGELAPVFDEQATSDVYSIGDVFTVDIPSEDKYYVVLKTHEPKEIKEIKVLKVVALR